MVKATLLHIRQGATVTYKGFPTQLCLNQTHMLKSKPQIPQEVTRLQLLCCCCTSLQDTTIASQVAPRPKSHVLQHSQVKVYNVKSPSDASRQQTMLGSILHCLIAVSTPVASPGSEASLQMKKKHCRLSANEHPDLGPIAQGLVSLGGHGVRDLVRSDCLPPEVHLAFMAGQHAQRTA